MKFTIQKAKGLVAILLISFILTKHQVRLDEVFPWDNLDKVLLEVLQQHSNTKLFKKHDPTFLMTTIEIIEYYGYPSENHTVITQDGYVLELHRIPHAKNQTTTRSIPLLIAPPLLTSSEVYIKSGIHNGAGFIFADAGYDVWLHNHRGTRYSRKHVKLEPDNQKEFWDFSFHEMGVYDMPAAIDHILSVTNSDQVYIMGYSMGGTVTSIFLSEKPSYKSKVRAVFMLAPALNLETIQWKGATSDIIKIILHLCNDMEVMPYSENFAKLMQCLQIEHPHILQTLLSKFGIATANDTMKMLTSSFVGEVIGGASVKVINHYLQMIQDRTFAQYDYGKENNLRIYNQSHPPQYQLNTIKTPVSIIYGYSDMIVTRQDIKTVSEKFTNLAHLTMIADKTFGHLNIGLSNKSASLVFDVVLSQMINMELHQQKQSTTLYLDYLLAILLLTLAVGTVVYFTYRVVYKLNKLFSSNRLNESTHPVTSDELSQEKKCVTLTEKKSNLE